MLSTKVLLLSTGVLSTAVALRVAVPAAADFLISEVPRFYDAALVWLTPPYLYFVINVIIISIAASSRFQKQPGEEGEAAEKIQAGIRREEEDPLPATPVAFTIGDGQRGEEEEVVVQQAGLRDPVEAFGGGAAEGSASDGKAVTPEDKNAAVEEEFVISRSSWTPRRRESAEVPLEVEKPLVSVRFASRRGVKASPEGRALGVAKPKKSETLENTWKAITDGRAMPLTRHLRKSDTWGADGGRAREEAAAAAAEKTPVRKSETFKERGVAADSSPSPGGSRSGRLRRDSSLGQDELNRRVEAFIRKFNEEMRLQRQESFKHYMEMIKPDGR
ncbi:hypothetical protein Taro_036474 [Colocasia esculenta]|uniref:DUF4408 domain-containing protein n=1 Tax=Colocasia esculenta TaxID=4460 RepID=A0A843W9W2_COLES|nr:hypothetical protein [Colocasia esculenta]